MVDAPPTARPFAPADLAPAAQALAAARDRMQQAGREWGRQLMRDTEDWLAQLADECEMVFVGDYLLAYRIADGWFTPGLRFLDEVLVLRVYREHGNRLRSVVQAMERIARTCGCAGIHVGTFGDATGALAKAYQRWGFTQAPAQLYKEL